MDDAQMRDVARICEKHGIKRPLEIGLAEVTAFKLVFVGVGEGGVAGLPRGADRTCDNPASRSSESSGAM